jgi:very-short-patch-repair endonuclease
MLSDARQRESPDARKRRAWWTRTLCATPREVLESVWGVRCVAQMPRDGSLRPPPAGIRRITMSASFTQIAAARSTQRKLALRQRARIMRRHPTSAEALLWSFIRSKQLGVQFRRQVVLGNYIVDFLASSVRLIVEVDGEYHGRQVRLDGKRQVRLERAGYRVLRLENALVVRQPLVAVEQVRAALVQLGVA